MLHLSQALSYSMLLIWVAAIGVTGFGTFAALIRLRKKLLPVEDSLEGLQPVSILKPLKGIDPDLEENLTSFFKLDYPEYELLFSVAREDDPAIPIVQKLRRAHSHIRSQLYIGDIDHGPNPKINNMLRSYDNARYDWILISDSNTQFRPDHLRRLASQFKQGVAMQTSVVAGVEATGIGGHLETAFLNTFYARSVMALDAMGHPCVIGKSMLFRKSILERIGGLRSLTRHIAEDYAAGRKLHLLGFRVQVSRDPVRQHLGNHSFRAFWTRHVRWGRLRKMQAPAAFLIEPLFNSVLSGILGMLAFHRLWGVSPVDFLVLHFGLWFVFDLALASRVGDRPGAVFLPVWFLREWIHLPLWIHISAGSTVNWRGQTIRLKRVKFVEARFYAVQDLEEFFRKPGLIIPEIDEDFEEAA